MGETLWFKLVVPPSVGGERIDDVVVALEFPGAATGARPLLTVARGSRPEEPPTHLRRVRDDDQRVMRVIRRFVRVDARRRRRERRGRLSADAAGHPPRRPRLRAFRGVPPRRARRCATSRTRARAGISCSRARAPAGNRAPRRRCATGACAASTARARSRACARGAARTRSRAASGRPHERSSRLSRASWRKRGSSRPPRGVPRPGLRRAPLPVPARSARAVARAAFQGRVRRRRPNDMPFAAQRAVCRCRRIAHRSVSPTPPRVRRRRPRSPPLAVPARASGAPGLASFDLRRARRPRRSPPGGRHAGRHARRAVAARGRAAPRTRARARGARCSSWRTRRRPRRRSRRSSRRPAARGFGPRPELVAGRGARRLECPSRGALRGDRRAPPTPAPAPAPRLRLSRAVSRAARPAATADGGGASGVLSPVVVPE